jgi:hypothetical protein
MMCLCCPHCLAPTKGCAAKGCRGARQVDARCVVCFVPPQNLHLRPPRSRPSRAESSRAGLPRAPQSAVRANSKKKAKRWRWRWRAQTHFDWCVCESRVERRAIARLTRKQFLWRRSDPVCAFEQRGRSSLFMSLSLKLNGLPLMPEKQTDDKESPSVPCDSEKQFKSALKNLIASRLHSYPISRCVTPETRRCPVALQDFSLHASAPKAPCALSSPEEDFGRRLRFKAVAWRGSLAR